MPQKFENLPPYSDDVADECQHSPLNCPWTITSENETLTVVIIGLKWTSNYDFWIRVTAHPERNPSISKQIDIKNHNPLLVSLSEALDDYEDFSEPQMNSYHAGELANYNFGKERCFPLYSEDQPLSGTRTILPTQQPGRIFEQFASLDFQMDETNSDTAWKLNNVLEEMR